MRLLCCARDSPVNEPHHRHPVAPPPLMQALGTMISMETQTPVSTSCFEGSSSWCTIENWTNLISLYMGSVMYALLISNLSSIVLTVEMGQHLLSEKVKQVNEYMRSKRLPVALRDKVRDFFRLRFAEGKMFNETEILKEVSNVCFRCRG